MKKRTAYEKAHPRRISSATTTRTGEHCPTNGWWAPTTDAKNPRFVSEGSMMPSEGGGSVTWVLLRSFGDLPLPL
ncbi:hypothetical protein [Arthrobacter sp. NPDC058127]|uniref:hypothetical protein n=1 Tax=Arthrobacter sp. NPDC058127 TaxID=3346351 RepID=UPI0036EE45F5